jgi:hypothetical protein
MACDPSPISCEEGVAQAAANSQQTYPDDCEHAPPEKIDRDPSDMGGTPVDVNIMTETKDSDRPKGVRFALLYLCILLGSFFIGYVRDTDPALIHLRVFELTPPPRTQAA